MSELLTEQISHDDLKTYLKAFYKYAKKALNIERDPRIFFRRDQENADNFIGKTGYYDPQKEEIHLFITDRHAKDVVRSFAHELIHHLQKLTGVTDQIDMSKTGEDPAYSLHDDLLRAMEEHAFKDGNLTFRDWTDKIKIGQITVIAERKLKPSEKEKLIGLEKDVPETPFTKKYGKKKGKQIYYATLTKQAKKKKKSKTMKEEKTMRVKVKQKEKHMEEEKKNKASPEEVARQVAARGAAERGEEESRMDRTNPSMSATSGDDLYIDDPEGEGRPGSADDEELDIDFGEEEDTRTGGDLPMKSKERMELERKFGTMDAKTQTRLLAYLAQKAKDKKAAEIALKAELSREEAASEEAERRAKFASLPGAKPPMEEQLYESSANPYPVLFEQRERLLKEAYQTREERVYAELVRRFIKK